MKNIPLEILQQLTVETDDYGVTSVELAPIKKQCEDCGNMVRNRSVQNKWHKNPVPHWRKKCNACKLWSHPEENTFDMTNVDLHRFLLAKYNNLDK